MRRLAFALLVPCLLLLTGIPATAQQVLYDAIRLGTSSGHNYLINYYIPQAASTPWRPAFSPDGEEIAFSMAGSIWKMRLDEDVAYQLTSGPTYDSSPHYSPDGRRLVYTADEGYQSINLRLLDLAGGETVALTANRHVNLDPVWSPDGSRILYASTEPDGRFHLYSLPVEDGNPGRPVRLTEDHRFHNSRLYFGEWDIHVQPTFSPSGDEAIFVSNRGISLGSGAVWRAAIGPDMMRGAEMILREETLYRTRPQWSPGGARILYASHRGSQYTNLYVLPADGGEPYQLTFDAWDHFDPRWSPDGEQIVYVSNENGVSELRLLQAFGGKDRKIEINRRVYKQPAGTLDVRIVDDETGKPTPARVYLTASDGKSYAPADAYHRIANRALNRNFFHTTGEFSLDVPTGEVRVYAMKGFERHPARATVEVDEGPATRLELRLERMSRIAEQGWYGGSDHVHMNYGGNLHNTPENLMFMADAEDLDVVGEKIANKDNRIFDHQDYEGPYDAELSTTRRMMTWGEEYRPPFYGHISLNNLTEHLISPFTTGYEDTGIASLYPSNVDIFRLARKQGAFGGYVHPFQDVPEEVGYSVARGFPVDLALGTMETLEVMTSATFAKHTSKVLHRALNCGFKLTPVGGEDSISDLHATPALGAGRFYAYVGDKLTWERWMEAILEGRTFVTNGPLLGFEMNGEMPGSEIRLPAEGGTVELSGWLQTAFSLQSLEIIFRGEVVDSLPLPDLRQTSFRKKVEVTESGWFTLRATSGGQVFPIDDPNLFAETAPIYVYVGDEPIRSREDAEYFITWIDEITRGAEAHPGWRSEREQNHVLGQFTEARKVFEERAAEAE